MAPEEERAPGADTGRAAERPFCPEDAANLCFYEQNFIVASCLLGVCDQFHHRGHFKAFCL